MELFFLNLSTTHHRTDSLVLYLSFSLTHTWYISLIALSNLGGSDGSSKLDRDENTNIHFLQQELANVEHEKEQLQRLYEERLRHLQSPCKEHAEIIDQLSMKVIYQQTLLDEHMAKYRLKKADWKAKLAQLEQERNNYKVNER
jgi:hypothetical protein